MSNKVIFNLDERRTEDAYNETTGTGLYGGKTLADYEFEGNFRVMEWEEAADLIRKKFIKAPKKIDKERFWWLLEVLPPCKWRHGSAAETFHVSERISLDVVTWAVRLGDEYWELDNVETLSHEEVLALVLEAKQ